MKNRYTINLAAVVIIVAVFGGVFCWDYIDRLQLRLVREKGAEIELRHKAEQELLVSKAMLDNLISYKESNSYSAETILRINPNVDPELATIIMREVVATSDHYDLHPLIVLALIQRESGFNPMAKSKAGAIGLMQVLPKYHQDKLNGKPTEDLYHIAPNIRVGCAILSSYLKQSDGNMLKALHRYLSLNARKEHLMAYQLDILHTMLVSLMDREKRESK
jgi:DNA-binding protein Fis